MKFGAPAQLAIVIVVILLFLPIIVSSGSPGAASVSVPRSGALSLPTSTFDLPVPTDAPEPIIETGSPFLGGFTMSLSANTFNQDEADNVRWSLIRRSSEGARLWDLKSKVTDWAAVRATNMAGSITIPQGVWSFNSIFRAGVGYKHASGILAGGHCALASALKAAADNAGLPTEIDQRHSIPIPGFSPENSVAILWGRRELDLRVINDTGMDLRFVWYISGDILQINVERALSDLRGKVEIVRVSFYWPKWGPPNCAIWDEETKTCLSRMASGKRWEDWLYKAVACPQEWPHGTKVRLVDQGVEFDCQDHGGKIKYEAGYAWIDTLTDYAVVAWGSNTLAELIFP